MKQVLITLTMVITGMFSNSYANDSMATPQAIAAFEKQFSSAKEVSWVDLGTVSKVSFEQGGKYASAFYDQEGILISVTRNVSVNELPSALKKATKKQMNNTWISDLIQLTSENERSYYVTFESADRKTIMKSVNNKKWILFQVIEK